MVILKNYNDTYLSLIKLPDDYKKRQKSKLTEYKTLEDKEEQERISRSRTKRNIKELCLCNDFQLFGTMTVNSSSADRLNLEEVQDKMKKICKKMQRRYKNVKYLWITEKHKDGAFHFHGMFRGIPVYENEFGYLSCKYFDELGFNSFSEIKDYNACCNYITKYITKDCIKNDKNQVYFCSRGLKKADEEVMPEIMLEDIFDTKKIFENKYCKKVDFDINKLSKEQQYKIWNYFNQSSNVSQIDDNIVTNLLHILTNYEKRFNINL